MPPRSVQRSSPAATALASRVATKIGTAVLDERRRRAWTTRDLAERAHVSASTVNLVEAGRRVSLDMYARVATALGLSMDVDISSRRRRGRRRDGDLVHAAMGEDEARLLSVFDCRVAIDYPYQHYQFAGRADVLAWSEPDRALLHIENRTRFPDLQDAAGSFNAKCEYLAAVVARQAGLKPFRSEVHVIVALWSAEVLHTLRLRQATFRALCPDADTAFQGWLRGEPPSTGTSRTLLLFDPFATGRQRRFLGLEAGIAGAKPRVRGYAEAAARLNARGGSVSRGSDRQARGRNPR
jgi:transcriptional regulator with XRE-family HTH domain